MPEKNYLILDFGASNGRSLVAKYNGSKFKMIVTHHFDNQPVFASGTLYWDILRLYHELKIGIQTSLKKYKKLTSLGIDTWGADFGVIDKNGKILSNPVHYRDERRAKDSKSLFKIIPARELFKLTGAYILPIYDLFHLYSLKIQNSPEIQSADKILSIADIFNYFLTRNTYNEYTRVTTSILFNQVKIRIEDSIFDRLNLPKNIFPPIIMPGEKIGSISTNVAKELEVEPVSVIAPATHDTASAVAGIPVIDKNVNWAFISIGTWCAMGMEIDKPLISDEIFENAFLNEAGVEGTNIFVKNINGLWVIQQCRKRWLKEIERLSWEETVDLSSKARPFRSFINIEESQFAKPQLDMPKIIRGFCKETGQPIPETIGEVARCIYESLAMKFKYYLTFLENFTRKNVEVLHLVGGGTKNKLLCKWISNATGLNVVAGPAETTSVGNLLMQLKANGEISSLDEGRQLSLNSSEVISYQPEDKEIWDEAYFKYLTVL